MEVDGDSDASDVARALGDALDRPRSRDEWYARKETPQKRPKIKMIRARLKKSIDKKEKLEELWRKKTEIQKKRENFKKLHAKARTGITMDRRNRIKKSSNAFLDGLTDKYPSRVFDGMVKCFCGCDITASAQLTEKILINHIHLCDFMWKIEHGMAAHAISAIQMVVLSPHSVPAWEDEKPMVAYDGLLRYMETHGLNETIRHRIRMLNKSPSNQKRNYFSQQALSSFCFYTDVDVTNTYMCGLAAKAWENFKGKYLPHPVFRLYDEDRSVELTSKPWKYIVLNLDVLDLWSAYSVLMDVKTMALFHEQMQNPTSITVLESGYNSDVLTTNGHKLIFINGSTHIGKTEYELCSRKRKGGSAPPLHSLTITLKNSDLFPNGDKDNRIAAEHAMLVKISRMIMTNLRSKYFTAISKGLTIDELQAKINVKAGELHQTHEHLGFINMPVIVFDPYTFTTSLQLSHEKFAGDCVARTEEFADDADYWDAMAKDGVRILQRETCDKFVLADGKRENYFNYAFVSLDRNKAGFDPLSARGMTKGKATVSLKNNPAIAEKNRKKWCNYIRGQTEVLYSRLNTIYHLKLKRFYDKTNYPYFYAVVFDSRTTPSNDLPYHRNCVYLDVCGHFQGMRETTLFDDEFLTHEYVETKYETKPINDVTFYKVHLPWFTKTYLLPDGHSSSIDIRFEQEESLESWANDNFDGYEDSHSYNGPSFIEEQLQFPVQYEHFPKEICGKEEFTETGNIRAIKHPWITVPEVVLQHNNLVRCVFYRTVWDHIYQQNARSCSGVSRIQSRLSSCSLYLSGVDVEENSLGTNSQFPMFV